MWIKPVLHPVILLIKSACLVVSFLMLASYFETFSNFHSYVYQFLDRYKANVCLTL